MMEDGITTGGSGNQGNNAEYGKAPTIDHLERERGHRYAKIIARAWADGKFQERLLAEPQSVFAEYELAVPENHRVRVVSEPPADTRKNEIVFVLPPKPAGWAEVESRPLSVSPDDDWLDGAESTLAKPRLRPPCAKCWNGCC